MQNIYSVSWVNAYIQNMFSQDFMLQTLSIKGEASNVKYHSSGHLYFTLKDDKGAISAILFAKNKNGLKFTLKDGMQIVVTGSVEVYQRDGKYQLYAKKIELQGIGDLYEAYEKLKQNLHEMGMFDEIYKQPIPKYVQKLGIVTSRTGAALQDILQIALRRNPNLTIIIYPALVQGVNASESICRGIQWMDGQNVDVIIVGRGGGSIEDLWPFNEECVAEAIFHCNTPIISAVGHEVDFTIADYVSDLRAPTPSAAAELAIFDIEICKEQLLMYQELLKKALLQQVQKTQVRLNQYYNKLELLSPSAKVSRQQQRLQNYEQKFHSKMEQICKSYHHKIELYEQKLQLMNPTNCLENGYAIATTNLGQTVYDIKNVKLDDYLYLYFKNGKIKVQVVNIEEKDELGYDSKY